MGTTSPVTTTPVWARKYLATLLLATIAVAGIGLPNPAWAQVPVDAASDRRPSEYVFFQSFGEPRTPFENLNEVRSVRENSARYFRSELATCKIDKENCRAELVYELADRFCQALEFTDAVTWRISKDDDELTLHWVVCGLQR